jgi:hypothetical protein
MPSTALALRSSASLASRAAFAFLYFCFDSSRLRFAALSFSRRSLSLRSFACPPRHSQLTLSTDTLN